MKPKTATIMVIAVGPKGNHRGIGGSPSSHSACGCEDEADNAPMISIPVEALSTDMEDGQKAMPEVGDEVTLDEVRGVLKKLENGTRALDDLWVSSWGLCACISIQELISVHVAALG